MNVVSSLGLHVEDNKSLHRGDLSHGNPSSPVESSTLSHWRPFSLDLGLVRTIGLASRKVSQPPVGSVRGSDASFAIADARVVIVDVFFEIFYRTSIVYVMN